MQANESYFIELTDGKKGPFNRQEITDMMKLGLIQNDTLCIPTTSPATPTPACVITGMQNLAPTASMNQEEEDFTVRQTRQMTTTLMTLLGGVILIIIGWVIMGHFVTSCVQYLERPGHTYRSL